MKASNRRRTTNIILLFFIVAIVLFLIWMSGLFWLTHVIHDKRNEVETLIHEQLGYPTQFDTIETQTQLNGISVVLNHVRIKDKKNGATFAEIQHLELYPNIFQSVLKRSLVLRKIKLDGLKMRFVWDKTLDKFKLSGLKGEGLFKNEGIKEGAKEGTKSEGSKHDAPKNLLEASALQQSLSIQNAEIEWQGQATTIIQRLSGQFFSQEGNSKIFHFKGTEALKFNEGNFFKPTPLELTFNTKTQDTHIKTGLANALVDCQYHPKEGFECNVTANQLDLASLHQNLVLTENDPAWLQWLLTALPKGFAEGVVKISGDPEKIDWAGELRYRKLDLHYSSKWPAIENAAGTIRIEKEFVEVGMNKGEITGAPIEKVTATIAPIASKAPTVVLVQGNLSGKLENGMEFLKRSPLENVYKTLARLNPKGGMDLAINLKIPLNEKPTSVEGALKVKDGHLMLTELNLPIEHMNGTFYFTENEVSTKESVEASFLKRPLKIDASKEGLVAETFLTSDFFQKQFPHTLVQYFKGGANVALLLPQESTKMILTTDLKGVEVNLPPPLYKKADDVLALAVEMNKISPEESQFSLHAPKVIDAKWKQKNEKKNSTLKNAHIVLGGGNSDWTNQNAIMVSGSIENLDVKTWEDFLEKNKNLTSAKIPLFLHVFASKLQAFGSEFKQTWINFDSRQPNVWNLEGPLLKGNISLPTESKNVLLMDLDYLNIPESENESEALVSKFIDKHEKTAIVFGCKQMNYGHRNFGQVDFRLDPTNSGYSIQDFTAKSSDFSLEASGVWLLEKDKNETALKGQLTSDNMGGAFQRLGFSSLEDGYGRIRFDLKWSDTPFDFALKKVAGSASIQIKSGQIMGVDPGLGKVVNLLSLDSIQRRMQLNFKDVSRKGFAFDTISASLKFQNSIANSSDLLIDGPSAKIALAGQINLATKGLNLNMRVTPKIISSSLPIAASIATGNPAIGVGVWVFDKLTGSKLSNLAHYDYQVTGTWDLPNIEEVRKLGPSRQDSSQYYFEKNKGLEIQDKKYNKYNRDRNYKNRPYIKN